MSRPKAVEYTKVQSGILKLLESSPDGVLVKDMILKLGFEIDSRSPRQTVCWNLKKLVEDGAIYFKQEKCVSGWGAKNKIRNRYFLKVV